MRGYLFADHTERLRVGASAVFIPDQHELNKVPGHIVSIASANTDTISLAALTSRYGGPIAVSESDEALNPLKTWYPVLVAPDQSVEAPAQMLRGQLHAKGKPESMIARIWRRVAHILIRETTL